MMRNTKNIACTFLINLFLTAQCHLTNLNYPNVQIEVIQSRLFQNLKEKLIHFSRVIIVINLSSISDTWHQLDWFCFVSFQWNMQNLRSNGIFFFVWIQSVTARTWFESINIRIGSMNFHYLYELLTSMHVITRKIPFLLAILFCLWFWSFIIFSMCPRSVEDCLFKI